MTNGNKLEVGVVGATGYAGAELVRLLLSHPNAEIAAVSSVSFEGKKMSDIYPSLSEGCDMTLIDADSLTDKADCIFAALPHGLSEELAVKCAQKGKVLIDLGADFRLESSDVYSEWYGKDFSDEALELHKKSVYGLCEYNRDKIKSCDVIANPGCYPTSIALGLMPAVTNGLVDAERFIIDSKSGVTGAGRGLSQTTHFPDNNEAFSAYKAGVHRHTPEIEQTLSHFAGKHVSVTFVPHLLPVNRGILSTIYCTMKTDFAKIRKCYEETYKNEHFVRVMKNGEYANIKNVRMSNFCDISLHCDERSGTLIVTSAIDNMVKGAAGQAIQNMNIRFGFEECAGISSFPPAF